MSFPPLLCRQQALPSREAVCKLHETEMNYAYVNTAHKLHLASPHRAALAIPLEEAGPVQPQGCLPISYIQKGIGAEGYGS